MDVQLETLVQYFEDSASSSAEARTESERARDYYDGIQLTSEEVTELKSRQQPPVIFNRIQPKIDYLLGSDGVSGQTLKHSHERQTMTKRQTRQRMELDMFRITTALMN